MVDGGGWWKGKEMKRGDFAPRQSEKTRQLKAYPWLLPYILAPATDHVAGTPPLLPPSTRVVSFGIVLFFFFFSIPFFPLPYHSCLFSFLFPKTDSGLAFS